MKIYFKNTQEDPTSFHKIESVSDTAINLSDVNTYLEKHKNYNWIGFNVGSLIYWISRDVVTDYAVLSFDTIKEIAYEITVNPATRNPLDTQVGGEHYKTCIQPVEYIHANNIGYFEGCVIKYVTRWRDKGGIQDLDKAIHYLELLKQLEQDKQLRGVKNADNT